MARGIIMPGPETGSGGEEVTSRETSEKEPLVEITVDSETKYWVDFWHHYKIEIDENEAREAITAVIDETIEKFGKEARVSFIPNIPNSQLIWLSTMGVRPYEDLSHGYIDRVRKSPNRDLTRYITGHAYAFGYRNTQEPEDTGDKTVRELEESDEVYMAPVERFIAGTRFFDEIGKPMDSFHGTTCPNHRFSSPGDHYSHLEKVPYSDQYNKIYKPEDLSGYVPVIIHDPIIRDTKSGGVLLSYKNAHSRAVKIRRVVLARHDREAYEKAKTEGLKKQIEEVAHDEALKVNEEFDRIQAKKRKTEQEEVEFRRKHSLK